MLIQFCMKMQVKWYKNHSLSLLSFVDTAIIRAEQISENAPALTLSQITASFRFHLNTRDYPPPYDSSLLIFNHYTRGKV